MKNKIVFTKIRNVKSPTQAYSYPAGSDFYIPEYTDEFLNDFLKLNEVNKNKFSYSCDEKNININIYPGGRVIIPSGIRVILENKDTCLVSMNRSGIATKKGLIKLAELIDADYQGEIFFSLVNTGDKNESIKSGDKIIQLINIPVIYPEWNLVDSQEFEQIMNKEKSERSSNCLGSSD